MTSSALHVYLAARKAFQQKSKTELQDNQRRWLATERFSFQTSALPIQEELNKYNGHLIEPRQRYSSHNAFRPSTTLISFSTSEIGQNWVHVR